MSGAASRIVPIQTKQYRSGGKPKFCRITGDHRHGPHQFAAVIPIAWPPKSAEKLMRMRLEHDRAGAHDFSPFAPLIARRADLIETTMGGGQRFHLRERTLAGSLSGSIHIHHHPLPSRPVE